MTPTRHIRVNVFRLDTQREFADLLDTHQSSVSVWEKTGVLPRGMPERIRSKAAALKLDWDDSLFFEVPKSEGATQ